MITAEFLPCAELGDRISLICADGPHPVIVTGIGALPQYTKDFGALVAATWDESQEDENLEANAGEFFQLRMQVLDDVTMRFNNLSPTRQWRSAKTDFVLGQALDGSEYEKNFLWAASEFYVYESDTPRFDFYSTPATTTCRVRFGGWRFKFKPLPKLAATARVIWVSGWPTGAN